ncbi:FecR family protein [Pseudobacter ginsenosidimutans]|uniref:FecR family protein n=1 Tax=Pseudobacter ginsenosidimutans TaxID=661488 RepID=A0A4Q7N0F9_9BACT|nr:FecR domain-containing protein [Pseudobacter ginsenosidimutans]QEC43680.1 DUF4974 domain-containing protein [Pseudobacter ginsenosidimutans]RZS75081.1 FecR family protein [Pseudobacter ginsenosidimutans]
MNREEIEERLTELLVKQLRNELTDAESAELEGYCSLSPLIRQFADKWKDENYVNKRMQRKTEIDTAAAWKEFSERSGTVQMPMVRRFMKNRWVMAASLTGLIAIGAFFLIRSGEKQNVGPIVKEIPANEILPAKGNVVLTLADGKTISLGQGKNGTTVATQGNNELISKDNELVYDPKGEKYTGTFMMNTVSTGYSSLYKLQLSDGTRVWLNAQSVLKYPAGFTGNERRVELWGEGYFEVTADSKRPFYVTTANADIKVLGTRFDVNAYDSAKKIVLIEGAVNVVANGIHKTLRPGQLATVKPEGGIEVSRSADENHVLAWVNEKFSFQDAAIEDIMKELRRHYEIGEVEYSGKIDAKFNGSIARGLPLTEVLRIFSSTGYVQFNIRDKKIIVKP